MDEQTMSYLDVTNDADFRMAVAAIGHDLTQSLGEMAELLQARLNNKLEADEPQREQMMEVAQLCRDLDTKLLFLGRRLTNANLRRVGNPDFALPAPTGDRAS